MTADQWYAGVVRILANSFQLSDTFQWRTWWRDREILSPVQRLGEFIEDVLLKHTEQTIVIFIDEIDSVLSLQFPFDDFFALIRACYNKRVDRPAYKRLTFSLLGVATPPDLIQDKRRTPFNIGRAIELTGFQDDEAQPLAEGLAVKTDDPQALMKKVLSWSGGQPFLTQKVCRLILAEDSPPPAGEEEAWVGRIVQTKIIQNWEAQDEPEHLRTIRDRLLQNKRSTGRLLSLYQQILQHGQIPTDDSPEQVELRLSGLVVKQEGALRVYNPIYQAVFNQQWVHEALAELRPYAEAMNAWLASSRKDDSRLLHGQALRDALAWAKDKNLSDEDQQFLTTSQQEAERIAKEISEQISKLAKTEAANILKRFTPELEKIASHPSAVIREIQVWAGSQPSLIQPLCQLLISGSAIPAGEEPERIAHLVQARFIRDWQRQPLAAEHLGAIRDFLLEDSKCVSLLMLYRKILQQDEVIADDSSELRSLLRLGLVESQAEGLTVANKIYQHVFHRDWVEQALSEADRRRIIRGRYEVVEDIKDGEFIKAYRVKDRDVPTHPLYIVKKLIPPSKDADTLTKIQTLFDERLQEQYKLNGYGQIPELIASFEENQEFYTIQEFIDGHNLDEEIKPDKLWSEMQVVDLLIQVLEILEFVHRQNLTHLNIQPSNLRRRKQDGKIVLIDFGVLKEIGASIAKPEQIDSVQHVGSPDYALPKEAGDRSDASRDIYIVGAIGIQALTGIHPRDFSIDKRTNEVIWRYATPDRPMVKVNNELAKILTKIIRHNPNDRYLEAPQALQDLRELKSKLEVSERYVWFRDRRVIAGSIAGLSVPLMGGLIFYLGYSYAVRTNQINSQMAKCEDSISSIRSDAAPPTVLLKLAHEVNESCSTLIESGNAGADAYKHRGQAKLVLWQTDSRLAQNTEEQELYSLENILHEFKEADDIDNNDPQVSFYLGFLEGLMNQPERKNENYTRAINLYSEGNDPIKSEDYPILGELGRFLIQQNQNSPGHSELQQVERIYDLAEQALNDANSASLGEGGIDPNKSRIRYNLGILSYRAFNNRDAIENLEAAINLDPNFKLAQVALNFVQTLVGEGDPQDPMAAFKQATQELNAIFNQPRNRVDEYTLLLSKVTALILNENYREAVTAIEAADKTLTDKLPDSIKRIQREWDVRRARPQNLLTLKELESILSDLFPDVPVYDCKHYPVLAIANQANNPVCFGTPILKSN